MKIDDTPPYTGILFKFSELREAVNAARNKKGVKGSLSCGQLLKSILDGVYDRMETHAMNKGSGIAQMIYTEISGHAGLRLFQRLDAACLQNRRADSRASAPAPASSRGPGRNPRQTMPRNGSSARAGVLSAVVCYNCGQPGHIKPDCPKVNRDFSKSKTI